MNQAPIRRALAVISSAVVLVALAASPAWAPRIKGSVSAMIHCDGELQAGLFTFEDFSASGDTVVVAGSLSAGCSPGEEMAFTTNVTVEEVSCERLEYSLGDFTSSGHTVTFDSDSGFEFDGSDGKMLRRQLCATARVSRSGSAGAMAARLDLLHSLAAPVQTGATI